MASWRKLTKLATRRVGSASNSCPQLLLRASTELSLVSSRSELSLELYDQTPKTLRISVPTNANDRWYTKLDVFIEEGEPDLITTTEAEQHVVDGYEIDAETEQHIVLRDEIDHEEREIDGGELFMRYAILMVARLMLKNMMILMMVIMK
ncbi:hypothetical protein F2Q68_00015240 [Brassica cretica]|uniref:Uncharacterized protein n=1 Tax=Brassica cretica TaxID=69181 RepID=A0A8S9HHD0_BRACR|nr:hypothetical protein F2Q68_00015240 [Brassica cretica]